MEYFINLQFFKKDIEGIMRKDLSAFTAKRGIEGEWRNSNPMICGGVEL
jgi:hypothetical protein